MALIKKRILDKIELIGLFRHVHLREDDQIIEDSTDEVVVSGQWHRRVLTPDADISGEDAEVKRVAESVWTDEIKAALTDFQSKQEI